MTENAKTWELPELRAEAPAERTSHAGSGSAAPQETLQKVRERAEASGFEAGLSRGIAEAEARSRELLERAHAELQSAAQAKTAVEEAAAQLRRQDALSAEEASREAVELAYRHCEQILEREVLRDDAVLVACERAVALLPVRENVVLRVNPADVEQVRSVVEADAKVVADPMVLPGGCVAEAGSARVDLRWEAALVRVRESLGLGDLS